MSTTDRLRMPMPAAWTAWFEYRVSKKAFRGSSADEPT